MRMHVHACACMCMHVHASAYICINVHTCAYMCIHVQTYAYICNQYDDPLIINLVDPCSQSVSKRHDDLRMQPLYSLTMLDAGIPIYSLVCL